MGSSPRESCINNTDAFRIAGWRGGKMLRSLKCRLYMEF
jgi:hypothetical protein